VFLVGLEPAKLGKACMKETERIGEMESVHNSSYTHRDWCRPRKSFREDYSNMISLCPITAQVCGQYYTNNLSIAMPGMLGVSLFLT
jgi:hypothetical protein